MIYVSSDLHGYPLPAFLRLLEKARFSDADDLIILGDVIDRNGDGGIAMLRWMLQQINVRMILGNHEAMLLSCRFLFDAITDENLAKFDQEKMRLLSTWMMNGAEPTLKAMRELFREDEDTAWEIMEYLSEAPLYEVVDVPGRKYLLVHAGLGNFSWEKRLSEYTPDELLWTRPDINERYFQKAITVFGHTPTEYYGADYAGRMLKTLTWIDIDTGAASGKSPMLLRLDDEMPFYAGE
ncbi:MAG: metallophosphoesterase [Bacillota bacterium]|nr:metallophosphoesterase [Bacillota bacterium]